MKLKIPYSPTAKQQAFHDTRSQGIDEVLYGGAVGGGKSVALVIDATVHCLKHNGASAIIFRRTFPELQASIIDNFLGFIPGALYSYNDSKKIATFVNGSQLRFGYLEHINDRYRYQGAEFSYIAFDEVTLLHPKNFEFLLTRLRTSKGIPTFVRCSANPNGDYMEYYKERYVDVAPPNEVYIDEQGRKRLYIPARLQDNPYINEDYIKQLDALPENERNALLNGDWTIIPPEGAPYAQRIIELQQMGRITKLPIDRDLPVFVSFDLGINDQTALWFWQMSPIGIQFIAAYANDGVGLQHYVDFIKEFQEMFGVKYGRFFLPHDANQRELSTAMTRTEFLQKAGIRPITVLKQSRVIDGVEAVRRVLDMPAWFDVVRCKDGIKALKNYSREYDEKNGVFKKYEFIHNEFSHYGDSIRYAAIAIEQHLGYNPSFVRFMNDTN